MPFKVERNEQLDVSHLTLSGEVDRDHLSEAFRALAALPGYNRRNLIIYEQDVRLRLTGADVRFLADRVAADRPTGTSQTAVVTPQAVIYGLTRMYQALSEMTPSDVRLFRSVDDALDWLQEPPPPNGGDSTWR